MFAYVFPMFPYVFHMFWGVRGGEARFYEKIQDLYDFDPRGSSRSFATPRSWSFVSQLLSDDLPESTLTDLVAGCVGEGLAVKFMNHRKVSGQLPNPSDILSGKVKDLKTKEISAMYSLTVSLCYELQQAHEKNLDIENPNFEK